MRLLGAEPTVNVTVKSRFLVVCALQPACDHPAERMPQCTCRNYWETGHAYDGLNCSFLTDDHDAGGVLFEVQVHTPESFEVKQYESHALYELWRCAIPLVRLPCE